VRAPGEAEIAGSNPATYVLPKRDSSCPFLRGDEDESERRSFHEQRGTPCQGVRRSGSCRPARDGGVRLKCGAQQASPRHAYPNRKDGSGAGFAWKAPRIPPGLPRAYVGYGRSSTQQRRRLPIVSIAGHEGSRGLSMSTSRRALAARSRSPQECLPRPARGVPSNGRLPSGSSPTAPPTRSTTGSESGSRQAEPAVTRSRPGRVSNSRRDEINQPACDLGDPVRMLCGWVHQPHF
jgi:hypothetical protein